MKALMMLVLTSMLCTSCTALPAEERAFAVALCVEKMDEWRLYGRIPTYQSGGGYMTVTGEGSTVEAALSALDAASPMRINLSQLRLLVADAEIARAGELGGVLAALADRPDVRMQCAVALTEAPVQAVAEALEPSAGSRLSKGLDLQLAARTEEGTILPSGLAEVLRMGERQSPILAALTLKDEEIAFSGGYTMDGAYLTAEETTLLSLLLGHAKEAQLSLPVGTARVRDIKAKVGLSEDVAQVELTLQAVSSTFGEGGLKQALVDGLLALLPRLSAAECDALGLGRHAVMELHNMAQWDALNWSERYRSIRWEIAVGVNEQT